MNICENVDHAEINPEKCIAAVLEKDDKGCWWRQCKRSRSSIGSSSPFCTLHVKQTKNRYVYSELQVNRESKNQKPPMRIRQPLKLCADALQWTQEQVLAFRTLQGQFEQLQRDWKEAEATWTSEKGLLLKEINQLKNRISKYGDRETEMETLQQKNLDLEMKNRKQELLIQNLRKKQVSEEED
jgi:hypothetical protein